MTESTTAPYGSWASPFPIERLTEDLEKEASEIISKIDMMGGMLRAIEKERLTLTAVCLTHGHADHACGLDTILARHPVPVYIGEGDWTLLGWQPSAALRKFVGDGEMIRVGGKDLRFVTTPGHTPGGVCYKTGASCFVGDTLFAGSIGRANPPTLYPAHLKSVRTRLLTLPENFILFPGHGPSTTVREEKDHNPFG